MNESGFNSWVSSFPDVQILYYANGILLFSKSEAWVFMALTMVQWHLCQQGWLVNNKIQALLFE